MVFSAISHYLRLLSRQSIVLLTVLIASLLYNQSQNSKYKNCIYTSDIRFVDIDGKDSIILNIKNPDNSIEERRNIIITLDGIIIPEKLSKKTCERDLSKNSFFYISKILSESQNINLVIKNCRLIKVQSKGSITINNKSIQDILFEQGLAIKKPRFWEFWKQKTDFCSNLSSVKNKQYAKVKKKKKSRF